MKIIDILFSYYAKIYILINFSNKSEGISMAQESIQRLNYQPETPLLDSHVKATKPRREIMTRVTEAVHEAGMLVLLVIYAAAESAKQRREPPHGDIEQLREYGDWVD